jgi:hypothetical protein
MEAVDQDANSAPGFTTLLARELGYSALLDEVKRARSITCAGSPWRDTKSYEFRKIGPRRRISITWRDP